MCSVTTRADTRPEPLSRVFVYVRLCIVCYIRSCDYSWAPWVSWFDGQTDQQTDRWPAIMCQANAMVKRWWQHMCGTSDLLIYDITCNITVRVKIMAGVRKETWKEEFHTHKLPAILLCVKCQPGTSLYSAPGKPASGNRCCRNIYNYKYGNVGAMQP